MQTALMIIQLVLAVGVIAFVTLQPSKGEGLGAVGGGSQLFFGKNKGFERLLERLTTVFAILFMISSLVLAILS